MLFALVVAVPASAQIAPSDPPGPYAIDLRGMVLGVPQDPGFFPVVPAGTVIPSRGFGFEAGGHVYVMRVGGGRLGIGASALRVRASSSPPEAPAPAPGTTPTPRTIPDLDATLTIVAPQLSLNFGSAAGWSYVSGGYGFAESRVATGGIARTAERESGRLRSYNAGGGARWFRSDHLAFSFDVRVHIIDAKGQPVPLVSTPRSILMAASVGISLR